MRRVAVERKGCVPCRTSVQSKSTVRKENSYMLMVHTTRIGILLKKAVQMCEYVFDHLLTFDLDMQV